MDEKEENVHIASWKSGINDPRLSKRENRQKLLWDKTNNIHKHRKMMYVYNGSKSRQTNENKSLENESLTIRTRNLLESWMEAWKTKPYLQGCFGIFIMIGKFQNLKKVPVAMELT